MAMFAFVLGTVPLFFGLGYLAAHLGEAWHYVFINVAAVMIVVLAVVSPSSGLALLGVAVPNLSPTAAASNAPGPLAMAQSGAQEAVVRADPAGYAPNLVQFKVGRLAHLKVVTGEKRSCSSSFVIPSLGIHKILNKNDQAVIDISMDKPARIPFTCSMGM